MDIKRGITYDRNGANTIYMYCMVLNALVAVCYIYRVASQIAFKQMYLKNGFKTANILI